MFRNYDSRNFYLDMTTENFFSSKLGAAVSRNGMQQHINTFADIVKLLDTRIDLLLIVEQN